eukprot:gene19264-25900_t
MQLPYKLSSSGGEGCHADMILQKDVISTLPVSRAFSEPDSRRSAGPVLFEDDTAPLESPTFIRSGPKLLCSVPKDGGNAFGHEVHTEAISTAASGLPRSSPLPLPSSFADASFLDHETALYLGLLPVMSRVVSLSGMGSGQDLSSVVELKPKAAHPVYVTHPRRVPSRFVPQQAFPKEYQPAHFKPEVRTVKSTQGPAACPPPLPKIPSNTDIRGSCHDAEVEFLKQFGFFYTQSYSHCPIWQPDSKDALYDMSSYGL